MKMPLLKKGRKLCAVMKSGIVLYVVTDVLMKGNSMILHIRVSLVVSGSKTQSVTYDVISVMTA